MLKFLRTGALSVPIRTRLTASSDRARKDGSPCSLKIAITPSTHELLILDRINIIRIVSPSTEMPPGDGKFGPKNTSCGLVAHNSDSPWCCCRHRTARVPGQSWISSRCRTSAGSSGGGSPGVNRNKWSSWSLRGKGLLWRHLRPYGESFWKAVLTIHH